MMYNQTPFMPNGGYTPNPVMGYQYAPQQKVPKATNFLTPEEMSRLKKNTEFSLAVTQEEMTRGICNHKNEEGYLVAYLDPSDPTGNTLKCPICSHSFHILTGTNEEVQASVNLILDILQNIKTYYLDMSPQAGREFFKILPFIEKIPNLYKQAQLNFSAYENTNQITPNSQGYGFNMLNNLLSPMQMYGQPMGGNVMPGAPQYQYPPQAGFYNQPMNQPPMGQPAAYAPNGYQGNVFGYYGQPTAEPTQQQVQQPAAQPATQQPNQQQPTQTQQLAQAAPVVNSKLFDV